MDERKILIIAKGIDKTREVEHFRKKDDGNVIVKYYNKEETYSYGKSNFKMFSDPIVMKVEGKDLYYNNQILFNVKEAIRFNDYIKVFFQDGEVELFNKQQIYLSQNINNNVIKDVIGYFKEIAKYVSSGNKKNQKDDREFLDSQYSKLNYINKESVLNYYINKMDPQKPEIEKNNMIYPFRFNLSQKKAAENVYVSNISVIQGPPGTGKTQTILNIIANLAIMQNKSVAVVSNNNDAVANVRDKLKKYGYDFIFADLGRKEKREDFFNNLPQPEVEGYKLEDEDKLLNSLQILNKELDNMLEKNNEKALLEKEISNFELEQKYFEEYYKEQDIEKINKLSFYNKTDDRILEFILDTQILYDEKIKFKWLNKIKLLLKYGISLKKLDKNLMETILTLQREYYKIKIKKLKEKLNKIVKELKWNDFEKLQKEHQEISEKVFRSKLYKRYRGKKNDFNIKNYKNNISEFLQAFPIILSTTYSLRDSIGGDYLLDYVIIDESSQVDLLAGSLALSCAKNVVIVGDEKQLPQIVDEKIKEKISDFNVNICYDYFKNSILSAIMLTYGNKIPSQTLKEHYRCHPRIIEFCNKRFYNNELIAFATPEHLSIKKPLVLYYTAEGNHMRKVTKGETKGTYNYREEEVIKNEVLKDSRVEAYNKDEIGIVTPYRMQADNIQKDIENGIQSDTVHKYQGREKKLMIFSTVLDSTYMGKKGITFVDNPCMVNVAVSRAIDQFVVVTDNKLFNEEGKDIKALIKYIKYNELDSEIIQSQIVSVFDLLYKDYSEKLEKLNNRLLGKSKYKSEDIMDTKLCDILQKEEYKDYKYEREILVRNLFMNLDNLTQGEKEYVNNGARVDFVIYDKMNNKPALLIEVDGFTFHKNNPEQAKKDRLKDDIAKKNNIDIIRFETGEKAYSEEKIEEILREKLLK